MATDSPMRRSLTVNVLTLTHRLGKATLGACRTLTRRCLHNLISKTSPDTLVPRDARATTRNLDTALIQEPVWRQAARALQHRPPGTHTPSTRRGSDCCRRTPRRAGSRASPLLGEDGAAQSGGETAGGAGLSAPADSPLEARKLDRYRADKLRSTADPRIRSGEPARCRGLVTHCRTRYGEPPSGTSLPARWWFMEFVGGWPFARKLEETLKRALPLLGPEARAQVSALLTPQTLGVMAAVLVAWVLSHAVGIGEIIDIVILAVGVVGIGLSVFQGVDELYEFAMGTYKAGTTRDLDVAAGHFAKAVNILGVQAVLAVLLRGAPRTYQGGLRAKGPPTAVGAAYRPTLRWSKFEPNYGRVAAGDGWTTSWGDIVVSSRGSAKTRQLVMFHERIHQILTPKLYPLRDFRYANRNASYRYSSLSRFLEEALAETYAQLKVNGLSEGINAIRFPIRQSYVYLLRRGGFQPKMMGHGVVPELLGLAVGAIQIDGIWHDIHVTSVAAEPDEVFDVLAADNEEAGNH